MCWLLTAGSLHPALGAAGHVVPLEVFAVEAFLAGAEFLQIVGGGHAGGVEEVLVLADASGASFGGFALRGDAVDRDLGTVRGDRPENADLGAELIHQIPAEFMKRLKQQFPNAGFHKMLMRAAVGWFARHPN